MSEYDAWPIWFPLIAIEDPRMKPGHLAVLCAVRSAIEPHAFDMDDTGLRFGEPGRGIAIGQDRLRQLAGLSDAASFLRYERDLVQWGYILKELRPGRPPGDPLPPPPRRATDPTAVLEIHPDFE